MFSVYGVSGQLFRGSAEQLRQIGGVGATDRLRATAAIGRDGQDPASGGSARGLQTAPRDDGQRDDAHRAALLAYAQAQQPVLARHPLRDVAAVMSRKVITLPQTLTVEEAWHTLAHEGVGQAPVVDRAGVLLGLLTRADLISPQRLPSPGAHALVWRAWLSQRVSDIMVTPVASVAADTDIRHVARVLLDTALPGLAVVDDQGTVIGFVSRSDILRAVVADPPLDLWG